MHEENNKIIEVCSECFRASCWHGEFMCDDSQSAGTVLKTVSELSSLGLENSHHYENEKLVAVYGENAPHGYKS
jgi:hypothetical protein